MFGAPSLLVTAFPATEFPVIGLRQS